MKKVLKTTLLAASALALATGGARATLDIAFTDGSHVFTCADQTSCDLDGAAKNLLLVNTVVGDFRVTGTFATSSFGGHDNLEVSNLTIINEGPAAGTLTMVVGDTSFDAPVESIRESGSLTFNSNIGEAATLAFWADPLNGQPAGATLNVPGSLLFADAGTASVSPDSFSADHDGPFSSADPFSMTEWAELDMLPGATITGFNESMTSSVPEAGTWTMLVAGFAMLAAFGLRRKPRYLV
jgi:hypothetical protein